MGKIKVLNAYSGIGGNRKLWENVEVTAIELNPKIAAIYQDFFPQDKVIVIDAHQYLLDHFEEFDFIWSSPPCPTHSVTNHFLHSQGTIRYPDMSLWQEIIFLKHRFKGKWIVENVKSYYEPLYRPTEIERHHFWSNFFIGKFTTSKNFYIANARATTRQDGKQYDRTLEKYHGFILPKEFKGKRLALRNCVHPPLGLHILKESQRNIQPDLFK